MKTETLHAISNGVDMESLNKTVKAIQGNPELGRCTFRALNKWVSGGHNRTRIGCFKALGGEQSHKRTFELHSNEPQALGGTDDSPNPVEHLLNALAGCVTTSIVAHAAVRGIEIEELESQLEGNIDLRGFLGLDPKIPKGYQNIRIRFKVKASPENIRKLRALAEYSPVYNTLMHGTNVDIEIEPK